MYLLILDDRLRKHLSLIYREKIIGFESCIIFELVVIASLEYAVSKCINAVKELQH